MTVYYLDTSVAMHALDGAPGAGNWFTATREDADSLIVSSRLLQTEMTRALRRESRPVSDRDVFLEQVDIAPITESILTSAEAIVPHVKSLDAIHLATALALGSQTIVVSHDGHVKRVAEELGLRTLDPMA